MNAVFMIANAVYLGINHGLRWLFFHVARRTVLLYQGIDLHSSGSISLLAHAEGIHIYMALYHSVVFGCLGCTCSQHVDYRDSS